MPVRAVLFDLGNTLWHIPDPPLQQEVRNETVRRIRALVRSWGFEVEEHHNFLGRDIRLAITAADREAYESHCVSPDFNKLVHDIAAQHEMEITPAQAEELWETWNLGGAFFGRVLFEDAIDTLHELRDRGYRLACVTNRAFSGRGFQAELDEHGLTGLFDALSVSCDVGYMKPHQEIFQHALDLLDIAPGEAVMVGDSLRADVEGARALGMTGVWRKYARSPERIDGITPDYAVDELREIPYLPCFD
jgi:putative hydrolase of the HAD superfamily